MAEEHPIYAFGPFEFDPERRRLSRNGSIVRLTPKAADLLETFLTAEGTVLSKDELLKAVWPGTFVEEGNLGFHIHVLRQTLGDDAANPTYIETVPRRGYRFAVNAQAVQLKESNGAALETENWARQVDVAPSTAPDGHLQVVHHDSAPPQPPVSWLDSRRYFWSLAGAGIVLATLFVALLVAGTRPATLYVRAIKRISFDGRAKSGVPIRLDNDRLLLSSGPHQGIYWTDGSGRSAPSPFEPFHLIDVAPARQEALAIRPHDAGADRGLWIVSLKGDPPRRVGGVRISGYAVWSHDGRWIAYTDDGDRELNLTDRSGTSIRRLQTFSGEAERPQWAPGDRTIRLTVEFRTDRNPWRRLLDVAIDGSGSREPLSRTSVAMDPLFGDWLGPTQYVLCASAPNPPCQLWELDQSGAVPWRRSTIIRAVATTPLVGPGAIVGDKIYSVLSTSPHLYRYDQQRRAFEPYLGNVSAFSVRFATGSQWVAYVTMPDYALWRADPDGSHARVLIRTPSFRVDSFAISPDAHWIAVRGGVGVHKKIYIIPAEGGTPQPITSGDIEQGSPTWSANGTRIAFGDVPETFGQATGTECIHIYDRRTGAIADAQDSTGLWSARWSPDGRYLAGLTIREQALRIFDFASSTWRAFEVDHIGDYVWSADSQYLYCDPEGRTRWRARRVRVRDGVVEQTADLSNVSLAHYGAGLARDGSPLFLIGQQDLYELDLGRR